PFEVGFGGSSSLFCPRLSITRNVSSFLSAMTTNPYVVGLSSGFAFDADITSRTDFTPGFASVDAGAAAIFCGVVSGGTVGTVGFAGAVGVGAAGFAGAGAAGLGGTPAVASGFASVFPPLPPPAAGAAGAAGFAFDFAAVSKSFSFLRLTTSSL